jgi:hypothetical protein
MFQNVLACHDFQYIDLIPGGLLGIRLEEYYVGKEQFVFGIEAEQLSLSRSCL